MMTRWFRRIKHDGEEKPWVALPEGFQIGQPMSMRFVDDDAETLTLSLMQGTRIHTFTVPAWTANKVSYLFEMVHKEAIRFDKGEVGEDIS